MGCGFSPAKRNSTCFCCAFLEENFCPVAFQTSSPATLPSYKVLFPHYCSCQDNAFLIDTFSVVTQHCRVWEQGRGRLWPDFLPCMSSCLPLVFSALGHLLSVKQVSRKHGFMSTYPEWAKKLKKGFIIFPK